MIDMRFHNGANEYKKINYEANKIFYDPDQPRIKDILWNHYDWIEKTYEEGRLRDATTGSGYTDTVIPGSVIVAG